MSEKNQTDGLRQIKDQLARFLMADLPAGRPGNSGPFQPSPDALASVSRLTRELETKRQTSVLTDNEASLLKEVDKLWENIAKANTQKKISVTPSQNTYDLKSRRIFQENGDFRRPSGPMIPQISPQQADQIIAGMNEQFEEKVLKKIKAQDRVSESTAGRSLRDYLLTFKPNEGNIPRTQDDSSLDLNKLAKKQS